METFRVLVFNRRCWLNPAMVGAEVSLMRLLRDGLGLGVRLLCLLLTWECCALARKSRV